MMPTGYTSDLYDGKPQTFAEFVMQCAREMGAMITMRDESLSKPIPERFEPSSYHERELERAQARLEEVTAMSPEEANSEAAQDFHDALAGWEEGNADRKARQDRYEAMLAQVEAWVPPTTDHDGLKKFMRAQLEESIRFDCGYQRDAPVEESGSEWREHHIAQAKKDIAYHAAEQLKERRRAEERTEWVRYLRESLKPLETNSTERGDG